MVKCGLRKCSRVDSRKLPNLLRFSGDENKHSSAVNNQDVYRKISRMTDGAIKTFDNEMKVNTWDGFHNWLYCVCVVTFDLELGQALEVFST